MTSSAHDDYERTLYEAVLDAGYNERLQELHCRLFQRANWATSIITLTAGSAAAVGFINKSPAIAAVAGLVLAVLSIVAVLGNFGARAAEHRAQRRRYLDLIARKDELSLDAFDRTLHTIYQDDPPTIETLRIPAFNDNLRARGRFDETVSMSVPQKLFAMIA